MSNEPKKTTLAKTTLGWSIKDAKNPWAPEQQPYTQLLVSSVLQV